VKYKVWSLSSLYYLKGGKGIVWSYTKTLNNDIKNKEGKSYVIFYQISCIRKDMYVIDDGHY
jgi:hypothetical protein